MRRAKWLGVTCRRWASIPERTASSTHWTRLEGKRSMLKFPLNEHDHVLGNPDAPVTWIEYGDYECPSCRRAYGIVGAVLNRVGNLARFAFRNFPLSQLHPHALLAAQAAEAAAAQGRFWPMHDMLYEHQDS